MTAMTRRIPCIECDGNGYVWFGREVLGACPACDDGFVSLGQAMADSRQWLAAAFWFLLALALIVVWVLAQP